jgi:hypothetical protein
VTEINYSRSGGFQPPPDHETLFIDAGGTFSMWRSVSMASNPLSPIGRFAGQLDAQMHARLQAAAAAAAAAGDLRITPVPDAAIETFQVGGVRATMGAHDTPQGPWLDLVKPLRQLLGKLAAFPVAAIALEVSPNGRSARLVHRGAETLRIDLGDLGVRAVLWRDFVPEANWRASGEQIGDRGSVRATPGWSLELPFDHGFECAPGDKVVAYVTFAAFEGDAAVLVSLQTPLD